MLLFLIKNVNSIIFSKLKKKSNIVLIIFILALFMIYLYVYNNNNSEKIRTPKIFCLILTNPSAFSDQTIAANDTWARDCDDYRFISVIPKNYEKFVTYNKTSRETNYPFKILQPEKYTVENYSTLTSKIYWALEDIYKRYSYFDWYLKADDDTFIYMDHLRSFLKNKKSFEPVTYGFNIVDGGAKWQSGGAGYVLSNNALNKFGTIMKLNSSFCENTGTEDYDTVRCLLKLGVKQGHTEDDLGRERFHLMSINDHWKGVPYKWIYSLSLVPVKNDSMCCSNETISFHYINSKLMREMYSKWKFYLIEKSKNSSVDFHDFCLKPFVKFLKEKK